MYLKFLIRELIYVCITILHKFEDRTLIFEYRSKTTYGSKFEGQNKLGHHSYFCGEMGYASYIGANSVVVGKVGRFCSISENVHCLPKTHPTKDFVSTHPCFYSLKKQSGFTFAKSQLFDESPKLAGSDYSIEIGNDVYIGYGVTIIGPRRIGDGAIIAAGAVVTNDVAPFSIVGGVPAKEISRRFSDEDIKMLLEEKWWEKSIDEISNLSTCFSSIKEYRERYTK